MPETGKKLTVSIDNCLIRTDSSICNLIIRRTNGQIFIRIKKLRLRDKPEKSRLSDSLGFYSAFGRSEVKRAV